MRIWKELGEGKSMIKYYMKIFFNKKMYLTKKKEEEGRKKKIN